MQRLGCRHDLKELGEYLDERQAGLVVVVAEMEDDVKQSTSKADKLETRELEADHRRDRTGRQAAGGEQDAEDADTED
jgi:hypothetical protein